MFPSFQIPATAPGQDAQVHLVVNTPGRSLDLMEKHVNRIS